jgi:WD40 repeat protein
MALTHDWSPLETLSHEGSPRALRAALEALDWSAVTIEDDLPPLRAILQRLQQRFGVRPTHRWVTRKLLAQAKDVHGESGFVHTDGAITGVAMSPDGRFVATCNEWDSDASQSEQGVMGLWDVAGGRLVQHSEAIEWGLGQRYGSGPGQLQWSPDGRWVYAVHPSSSGELWSISLDDFLTNATAIADSGIGSTVHAHWTPSGEVAFQLGPIREWPFELVAPSIETDDMLMARLRPLGSPEGSLEEQQLGVGGWFIRARFSEPLGRAVCVSSDGSLYFVDTRSGRVVEWHSPRIQTTRESNPDARLFTRAREGAITIAKGAAWKRGRDDADAPLSPDGRSYVCVRNKRLCAVDLETQRELAVLSERPSLVHSVQWDSSGERVAVAEPERVCIVNVRTAAELAVIELDTRLPRIESSDRRVFDLSVCAFSRGSTLFAAVDHKGAIHCFDADFREIAVTRARARAASLAWGRDDRSLVSWGEGVLEFWDTRGLWRGAGLRRIGAHDHLSPGDERVGRRWSAPQKPYSLEDGEEFVGPALDGPDEEPWRGEGLRALMRLDSGRAGARHVFFALPGEERFGMFAFYRVGREKRWALVARPEHLEHIYSTLALVVDSLHAWPFEWAVATPNAQLARSWIEAIEIDATPEITDWRERVLEE